jgi:hypothetical protein
MGSATSNLTRTKYTLDTKIGRAAQVRILERFLGHCSTVSPLSNLFRKGKSEVMKVFDLIGVLEKNTYANSKDFHGNPYKMFSVSSVLMPCTTFRKRVLHIVSSSDVGHVQTVRQYIYIYVHIYMHTCIITHKTNSLFTVCSRKKIIFNISCKIHQNVLGGN